MKTTKIDKKLTLQKTTITQLDNTKLETIKGGFLSDPPKCTRVIWCVM